MSGREKTKDAQRFPLAWQGADGRAACCGNFGRGSLASSHAGTRLPIAAFSARTQGAPPLSAPGFPGRRSLLPQHVLSHQSHHFGIKKTAGHRARGEAPMSLPVSALPVPGSEGRSGTLPLSLAAPLWFSASFYIPRRGRVKDLFVKKSANPLAMAEPGE